MRGCWNRQTGKLEVLVSVLACGFKSHFPHQCKGHSIFECPLFLYLGKSAKHYHQKQSCWNRTKSLISWKRNLFRSQTGKPQVPQSVLACGFKSHFPHQCKGHSIFRVSFIFVLAKTYALQYAEKLWQFHCCHSFQFIEKVCFFKKVLVLNPYPQTPFPGKGAECGAAALTPLGATPQTPF